MLSEHNKFLEQAYLVLNRVYFEDSLPEAVITIHLPNVHMVILQLARSGRTVGILTMR